MNYNSFAKIRQTEKKEMQSIVPNVMNVEDTIFFVICVKGERSQNNSRIPSTSILLKQKKNLWFSFEK